MTSAIKSDQSETPILIANGSIGPGPFWTLRGIHQLDQYYHFPAPNCLQSTFTNMHSLKPYDFDFTEEILRVKWT